MFYLTHEVHWIQSGLEQLIELADGGLQFDDSRAPVDSVHLHTNAGQTSDCEAKICARGKVELKIGQNS